MAFAHSPGKAVGQFTGLVTQCVSGTGYYLEPVAGYFFDSDTSCFSSYRNVSGTITGQGQLTGGPYGIIFDNVAAALTETQIVAGTGSGILVGVIPNFSANFENVPAFGYLSGTITGFPTNGGYSISEVLYSTPSNVYSVALSGTKQAKAFLAYNTPQSGDKIYINDTVIIYDTNTGNLAPTYFKSSGELINIINSGSGVFLATGYVGISGLYLTSLARGEDGNLIKTNSTGSVTRPVFSATGFTGGFNYYYPLEATELFSGLLDATFYSSGLYSQTGSGYLTGTIKQLDFIRYFTGVWGLSSGDVNFQTLAWVTGGLSGAKSKYQNIGFTGLPFYSGNPDAIPFTVTYNNFPLVLSNDFAKLTVTGLGTSTGIEMILSGQF